MFSIYKISFILALSLVLSFSCQAATKAAPAAAAPGTQITGRISCPNKPDAHPGQTFLYSISIGDGTDATCLQWCQSGGPQPDFYGKCVK